MIEKVFGIHATDMTMDFRFTQYANLPVRFRIIPIQAVEWASRSKTRGIIRGQNESGRGLGNYRRWNNFTGRQNYRRNRGQGAAWQNRANWFQNNQSQYNNNNNGWRWQKKSGGIRKRRGKGGQFNGNWRNNGNQSLQSLPSKEELDKQLEDYMAGSSCALNKELDQYMTAGADPMTMMLE